jgi:hypothetical protein
LRVNNLPQIPQTGFNSSSSSAVVARQLRGRRFRPSPAVGKISTHPRGIFRSLLACASPQFVSSIRRFAGCSLLLAAWTAPRGSRWCPASPRAPSWRSSPASPLSRCADSSASPRPGATSSLTPSTARSSTPYPRRLLLQRIRIRGDACDCQDRESDGGGCSVGGGDDQRGWWTRTSPSSPSCLGLSVSGYCITANGIFLFLTSEIWASH